MPKLALEARPSSKRQGSEPTSPPSSPTKVTADPDDITVVGISRSTEDQDSEIIANHSGVSSNLDASKENVVDSHMESASRDCFTCSHTDEITIRIAQKKYRKRVQASCSQGKGNLRSEAQLKWMGDNCQVVWGHDQEIIRTERNCFLEEDHSSFEMCKMMARTDQLLFIKETTNSIISYSVGLKSFCPWCLKLGRNTEMKATNLSEVYYRMMITCDLCKAFSSMYTQGILDHHSGCNAKYTKECAEQEGHKKVKSHKRKCPSQENRKKHPNH